MTLRFLATDDSIDDDDLRRGSCLGDGSEPEDLEKWFMLFACLDLRSVLLLVCLIVLGMLVLCVMVEEFFELMHRLSAKSNFWRSFLLAVEKELMVLGVVSFSLFLFEQQAAASSSHNLEEVAELIEYVHLLLFFGMVAYYVFVAFVGALTLRHLRILRQFEDDIKGDGEWTMAKENELLTSSDESLGARIGWYFGCRRNWEMYNFYRMKHVFLTSQKNRNNPPAGIEYFDLSFANFSYTDYVSSCTTHLFVKMIHVGWRVWCTVIAVVSMLCLVLYLIDDPTDTLGNQLHNMWLSDGHFVQDNNFVVDRMNVIGFVFLVVARLVYIGTTSDEHLDRISRLAGTKLDVRDAGDVPLLGGKERTPVTDPLRRCSSRSRNYEDPYRTIWFLKAPDLMIRIYQCQILFFSMYAACFVLNLRFANKYCWIYIVVYPVLVLFGMAYKLIPHYAMIRYVGTLTLDDAMDAAAGGSGSVSDRVSGH